jgi:hypothetical protein
VSITSYPNLVRLSSTGDGNLVALGGTNVDAFGRLRTAAPFTLFDSQNRFGIDTQFDTSTTGSGATSHLANESSVQMSVTTASGDEVIRESKRVFPYQPGKSLLVMATFVFAAQQENLRQRVGFFGANDGVYFEQNGTDVRFVVRTSTSGSASDTGYVAQSNWNVDKLDGTGPSGKTLNVTTSPKAQILFMDFEWLGVGTVRCGFVIDGQFIVCHKFHHANDVTSVYMKTAILPLRYEITATGTLSSSADMKQICSSVISEGGYQQVKALSWARMTAATTVTTSFEPLVSIRLNSGSLDAVVLPAYYTVFPIPNNVDYEIALIKNPTLTGASYNTATFDNVDFDVSATALSGGTIVLQNYTKGTNQSSGDAIVPTGYNFDLQVGRTIAGTSDVYTLAARTISGTDDIIGCLAFWDLTNGA